jgi:sn-glycerol 3-phosphate transport system substrate-binding protein
MILTSSANAGSIMASAAENDVEVITSPMIYDKDYGSVGNLIGGATMWISDGLSPQVEEGAMAFLLYFSNTKNSALWHQASGYIPIRYSSIDLLNTEGWYAENPNFYVASIQINSTVVTPATQGAVFGTFVETRDLVTQAIEDAMLKGGDVAEILAEAETEANIALKAYNSAYEDD